MSCPLIDVVEGISSENKLNFLTLNTYLVTESLKVILSDPHQRGKLFRKTYFPL